MTLMYRRYTQYTDCEINLLMPPDMLEDLSFLSDESGMDINDIVLESVAYRLSRSQDKINEARLRYDYDCYEWDNGLQRLVGMGDSEIKDRLQRAKKLQQHVKQRDAQITTMENLEKDPERT